MDGWREMMVGEVGKGWRLRGWGGVDGQQREAKEEGRFAAGAVGTEAGSCRAGLRLPCTMDVGVHPQNTSQAG